jgi:hypothetical protein
MITTSEVILMYNYRCDNCGAYLDPGERCTCHDTHEKNLQMVDELLSEDRDGQMILKEVQDRGIHTRL